MMTGAVGGCADTGPMQGAGGVWLGKKDDDDGECGGRADIGSVKGAGIGAAEGSVCLGWMLMLLRDVRLRAIIGRAMLHRLVKELSNGT